MRKKGFTLLELIVVIIIIGVLSSMGMSQYTTAVEKAKFAELYPIFGDIARAEYAYYLEHGGYTDKLADLGLNFTSRNYNIGCNDGGGANAARKGTNAPYGHYSIFATSYKEANNIKQWYCSIDTDVPNGCAKLGFVFPYVLDNNPH